MNEVGTIQGYVAANSDSKIETRRDQKEENRKRDQNERTE